MRDARGALALVRGNGHAIEGNAQIIAHHLKMLSFPARWRLDRDLYALPVELWLNNKLKKKIPSFKPAVDAKRLEPATGEAAC